jgi:hypothetical protein
VIVLLAAAKGGEGVKSGPLGLAAILVLCIACYFLFKSMAKHLRKVREEFPSDDHADPAPQQNTPMESRDSTQPSDVPPTPDSSPP